MQDAKEQGSGDGKVIGTEVVTGVVGPGVLTGVGVTEAAAPKKSAVYTRTGDGGWTSLFNGDRGPKNGDYFDALGDVDELNAAIGLAREHCLLEKNDEVAQTLADLQSRLLDLGAHIATPISTSRPAQLERTQFSAAEPVERLERAIDVLDSRLPKLKTFILPSGGLASCHLHVARTVCRRAERRLVALVDRGDADPTALKFINRLSDYLFVAARTAAAHANRPETLWHPLVPRPVTSTAESSAAIATAESK